MKEILDHLQIAYDELKAASKLVQDTPTTVREVSDLQWLNRQIIVAGGTVGRLLKRKAKK